MKRVLTVFAVALLADTVAAAEPKGTDTNFDNLKPLVEGIRKADKVTLYEGLPHPFEEKRLLEKELKEKKTVMLHGFAFYAQVIGPKEADAKKLAELFGTDGSFVKFGGPKKCGGFHPDWAIEWKAGDDVYRALVCFGCHEVKIYGPKHELHADVRGAYKPLQSLLKGYDKNRPTPGDGKP